MKIDRTALGGVLVLFVAGGLYSSTWQNENPKAPGAAVASPMPKRSPEVSTTATVASAPDAYPLAVLDKAFDENPGDALDRFGSGPIVVEAEIEKVLKDKITLKTIYLVPVDADFSGSLKGLRPEQKVTLRCQHLDAEEVGGGNKPHFSECSIDVFSNAPLAADEGAPAWTAPKGMSAKDEGLVSAWFDKEDLCRGSPDETTINRECPKRDALQARLRAHGWCWVIPGKPESEANWHPCSEGDTTVLAEAMKIQRASEDQDRAQLVSSCQSAIRARLDNPGGAIFLVYDGDPLKFYRHKNKFGEVTESFWFRAENPFGVMQKAYGDCTWSAAGKMIVAESAFH